MYLSLFGCHTNKSNQAIMLLLKAELDGAVTLFCSVIKTSNSEIIGVTLINVSWICMN